MANPGRSEFGIQKEKKNKDWLILIWTTSGVRDS